MSSDDADFLAKGSTPHTLRVIQTQPNPDGTGGWEVVLSLDGFYWRREDAVRAAERWNARAREASLDIVRGRDAPGRTGSGCRPARCRPRPHRWRPPPPGTTVG